MKPCKIKKIFFYLLDDRRTLYLYILNRLSLFFFSDRLYISIKYRLCFGEPINLDNPSSFNEKLNWLKLHDRNPLYTILVDKYEVKKYVSNVIGSKYIVPSYGVWDKFENIDFENLPNSFVLKATHDSSGALICSNKSSFDFMGASKHLNKVLNRNYFYSCREWPYKNVQPRIIADEYLKDDKNGVLLDYKFLCFNGVPIYMYCTVKGNDIFENFYDMNFNPVNFYRGYKRKSPEFSKPINFELMKTLACKLSKNIPFVRIDFFEVNEKVYFGEYTFFDWGGFKKFSSKDVDLFLGDLIELNKDGDV
jgi:hypothetical protein